MDIHKTKAVVLKREKYSDTSQVIVFLTSDRGRLSCIAKGSRRSRSPFGDALSLIAHCEIVYYFRPYRVLQIVAESDLEWFPWTIRENPLRFLYASIFTHLILDTVSGQAADPALFNLVATGLRTVDSSRASGLPALFWSLQLQLLEALGYRPVLDRCALCKNRTEQGRLYLDPVAGGLTCERHGDNGGGARPISAGTARLLTGLLDLPLEKATRHRAGLRMRSEIQTALSAFLNYHLGVAPNPLFLAMVDSIEAGSVGRGRR